MKRARRPCPSGKIKHFTRGRALKAAQTQVVGNLQAVAPTGAPEHLYAHHCEMCGAWHLTVKVLEALRDVSA